MEILLIFPGFILAIITMVIYEIKLRKPLNKVRFFVNYDINTDTQCLYAVNLHNIPFLIATGYDLLDFGIENNELENTED